MATRRERVVLELEDNFTTGMARAAASTALLKRELNNLSGTAVRGAGREFDRTARSADDASDSIGRAGRSADSSGKQIDKLSGRLRLFADAAVTLGPALIPIGAAAIPAIAGLTAGLGTAALAVGTAVAAFGGLGDALDSLDAYQLEPTAENLAAMREEFDKIGPTAEHFVKYLDSLEPELQSLQDAARDGLLPGMEDGINRLLPLLPQVRNIISSVATEMGKLSREAGGALAGDGFAAFFDYVESDAAPTIEAFAHTLGNVIEGFANLVVAFAPLTRSFTSGMESMSQSFADWAANLSQTDGFQNFLDYIRDSGPQVVELIGAIASALVGIIKAAAPVGQAVVPMLTQLAKAMGAIADSPIGAPLFTAAAGLIAFNRASKLFTAGGALAKIPGLAKTAGSGVKTLVDDFALMATSSMTAGAKTEREMARVAESTKRANMAMASVGKGVTFVAILTGIGLVNEAFDNLADNINTTDLERNLEALSRGAAVDDLRNIGRELSSVSSGMAHFNDKLSDIFTAGIDTSELERAQGEIEKVDQALAAMVEGGRAKEAARAFQQILAQAEASGVSAEEASKRFDAYQTAVANAGAANKHAATAIRKVADAAGNTASELRGLVSAMERQKDAALSAFGAETRWRQALKDAAAQAAKNTAGIRGNSKAALSNRQSLEQLAGAWNNQSRAVKNTEARFQSAKAQFIQTATAMGVPQREAEKLAQKLLDIPRSHVTQISLTGSDSALNAIARIKAQLAQIPRSLSTTYYVNQVNSINRPPAPGMPGRADGGTIPHDGGTYRDKYLYMLAPGEEVISNRRGQADRFRPLLKEINAAADGATVGGFRASSRMFSHPDAVDALVRASRDLAGGFERVGDRLRHDLGGGAVLASASLKDEMVQRKKLLSQAVEDAKAHRDAVRQELADLRDSRRQLMQSARDAFTSDIFGGNVDLAQLGASQSGPKGFTAAVNAYTNSHGGSAADDWSGQVEAYLASLSPDEVAAWQAKVGLKTLTQDAGNARDFRRALRRAKRHGLSGGLLDELRQSMSLGGAQQFAGMTADQIRAYEKAYRFRQQQVGATARYVGNDGYGAAIKEQTKELRESRKEYRETNQSLHRVEQRLARLEKAAAQDGPDRTAKGVAHAINGAVSHGQRSTK